MNFPQFKSLPIEFFKLLELCEECLMISKVLMKHDRNSFTHSLLQWWLKIDIQIQSLWSFNWTFRKACLLQGCKTKAQNEAKPLQINDKQRNWSRLQQAWANQAKFSNLSFSRTISIEVYVCCSLRIYTKYVILKSSKKSRLESRYLSRSESR